jgi:NAD(P)H-hydrate epimerase
MKIFSAAQIRDWDNFTIKTEPITGNNLMERAASTCFKWLKKNIPTSRHVIVCCGNGNNGGDGLVIAKLLHKAKYKVAVYMLSSNKRSEECAINLKRLSVLKLELRFIETAKDFPAISKNAVVLDCLFGTGLNRPIKNIAARLVNFINEKSATVISIDLPSGLYADTFSDKEAIIKATHTLSFEINKLAFLMPENADYSGQVHLMKIGLNKKYYKATSSKFETIDPEMIGNIYQPRNAFAHKYTFGHALLYAGSKNMMGAGLLCTEACLRTGSGLATIHVSPGCEAIIHTALPEAITTSVNDTTKCWMKKTAIAIGPGLENTPKNQQLLKKLLAGWDGPLVIDATALSLLVSLLKILPLRKIHPAILTPHSGEFEKLFGKTNNDFERLQLAAEKAATLQCYIILKGHNTLIACPDGKHYFNTTGNAGMATAGSGDTLTGIIVGLLAQGYGEKEACLFGVYLHGLAGDIAAEKTSQEAMIAGDIIDCLGEGFKKLQININQKTLLLK